MEAAERPGRTNHKPACVEDTPRPVTSSRPHCLPQQVKLATEWQLVSAAQSGGWRRMRGQCRELRAKGAQQRCNNNHDRDHGCLLLPVLAHRHPGSNEPSLWPSAQERNNLVSPLLLGIRENCIGPIHDADWPAEHFQNFLLDLHSPQTSCLTRLQDLGAAKFQESATRSWNPPVIAPGLAK
ncbi:hypothetical protein scyTo_0005165 [Scyliorhinus torazame]|uniref:Uncharacterized protein n=1 Tax=Scyliorhinus torazame TaxID=75743 RepID=A0A401P3A9_SCYTO|nr:hypothetical protein [Scyliorhinus torazame]